MLQHLEIGVVEDERGQYVLQDKSLGWFYNNNPLQYVQPCHKFDKWDENYLLYGHAKCEQFLENQINDGEQESECDRNDYQKLWWQWKDDDKND